MDSIGAEVGQKMRSAIKAKLMELDCYVDDELPDYIMVMIANRRTRSQMNEDLNLFLSNKTSTFVNWLHIVLKKLKEVTVTNPEVYKKATKRKNNELPPDDKSNVKIKKEKIHKKIKNESQSEKSHPKNDSDPKSLTDDLPITANKLAEQRKIVLMSDTSQNSIEDVTEDHFDIPLLSEVNESNEKELQDIERKIRNVKNRLGLLIESDDDSVNVIRPDKEDSSRPTGKSESDSLADSRRISILENEISESQNRESENPSSTTSNIQGESGERFNPVGSDTEKNNSDKKPHKRITFGEDDEETSSSKTKESNRFFSGSSSMIRPSILDRLGKKPASPDRSSGQRKKINLSEYRQEEDRFLGYSTDEANKPLIDTRDRNNRFPGRSLSSRRPRDNSRERGNSSKCRERRNKSLSRDRSPCRARDRENSKNRDREPRKEGILSRLGVMSKVSVPPKPDVNSQRNEGVEEEEEEEEEEQKVVREVPSSIKVKPRVIPSDVPQPNKNLLLKAVAEAQRSVAQAPKVGNSLKPDALYTKKFKEKRHERDRNEPSARKLPESEKNKLKTLIQQNQASQMQSRLHSSDEYDSDGEYIPKPVRKIARDIPRYVPSSKKNAESDDNHDEHSKTENGKHQFIITLDGVEKKSSIRVRLEGRKTPSPIIFGKVECTVTSTKPHIPDKLPIVHPPLSIKNKERCKYWPGCRQGDKCEFVHPTQNCETFPHCKYGDKCLYLHPKCKFGPSCTKRDCPYDHNVNKAALSAKVPVTAPVLQNCRFFPNCTNPNCPFVHPKPCKYGKYCKNIADCNFSHSFVVNKRSLSWRSN